MKIEIEVGRYVRTEDNQIFKIEFDDGSGVARRSENYKFCYYKDIVKTASTPMELIQVYDLIEPHKNGYIFQVDFIKNGYVYCDGGNKQIELNAITKILTPNANGGYDLQWEAE